MYERFYNLRERPFALSPDPEYLYPSRVHQEALDYLRYGVESQAGFIVITGEIGSGKTTLLQTLLRNLDNQTSVGRIVNTMLEPRELLETIMIDFGLDAAGRSKPQLLRDLSQYLVDQRIAGRLVLLVIDEAQNLGLGALEELRMLSNLETEKSKLLQIVLVGQPNLRDKLAAPELEQLRQRITVSYHLPPLDADETGHYINHRLRRAALGPPMEFPRDATDLIHARSRGVPRLINVICDAALVFGYAEERREFTAATVTDVLEELETTGVLPPVGPTAAAPAAANTTATVPAMPATPNPRAANAPAVRPELNPPVVSVPAMGARSNEPAVSVPAMQAEPNRPVSAPAMATEPNRPAVGVAAMAPEPNAPAVSVPAMRAEPNPPAVNAPALHGDASPVKVSAPAMGAEAKAPAVGVAAMASDAQRPGGAQAEGSPAVEAGRHGTRSGDGGVAVAARPAPAAPIAALAAARSAEAEARTLALEQREQSLRQRELELAEQRRVLSEEYRLLRAQRQASAPGTAAASPIGPIHGRARTRDGMADVSPSLFNTEHTETFWSRLKRIMLGVSAS